MKDEPITDTARERALLVAAKTALGLLDDPTGGTHVSDMRAASQALRVAIDQYDEPRPLEN